MNTPSAVPDIVLELVERFTEHLQHYLSPSYNETQVRVEFVNPLFEALGWDLHNKQGFAEPWKQIVHEDAIEVGGSGYLHCGGGSKVVRALSPA